MTLSNDALAEVFAPESDGFLVLLTIEHDDLAVPIRVVNNTEDVDSNGETYTAFPFEVSMPTDSDDGPPRMHLVIDNISREIGEAIRTITSPATVSASAVRLADPDSVEATAPDFTLRNVTYDALTVQGDLELEDVSREPFPARTYSPAEFPGLLR